MEALEILVEKKPSDIEDEEPEIDIDYLKSYQSNIYKELDNRQKKIKDRIV